MTSTSKAATRRRLAFLMIFLSLGLLTYLAYNRWAAAKSDPASEVPERLAKQSAETEIMESDAPGSEGSGSEVLAEARESVLRRMWWNREKFYASVELDLQQRLRMDERLLEFQREQSSSTRRHEAFQSFRRSVTDGEFDLARQRADELGRATAEPTVQQALMMVDILSMLTPEQHRKLMDHHAGILAGPWLTARGMNRRGGERVPD